MVANSSATVADLYRGILGRAPDDGAIAQFVPALDSDTITPDALRIGLANSPEAQGLLGGFYTGLLGRTADAAGLLLFTDALASGRHDLASVRAAIAGSPEAAQAVATMYSQTLSRNVDPAGLGLSLAALTGGAALSDLRAGLGASGEAADSLARAYEYQFGTAPTAVTLTTLQGELSRGKSFRDTVRVDQNGSDSSRSGLTGYTVEAQYSATGQADFIGIFAPTRFGPTIVVQSQQVPYDQSRGPPTPDGMPGQLRDAPSSDRIVVDLYKQSDDPAVGISLSLDGKFLGRATIRASGPTVFFRTAVDEITLLGPFGPGLHDLRILVDDPARGGVTAVSNTFDGNSGLFNSVATGASGSLDLFPHSGPQPPVNFLPPLPRF